MSSSESQIPSGRGVITYRILRVVEHVNAIGGIVEKTLSGMTDSTTTIAGDAERESHEIQVPVDEMIRSACKDELEIGFGRIVPQIMEGISASIRQELHSVSRVQVSCAPLQADPSRLAEFETLSVKYTSLQEEVKRLQNHADQTQRAAAQMVKEAEMRARENAMKLHKIILDSGLGESGPTDDEVEKEFGKLYHLIFQFVMKFCQNHESTRGIYSKLMPEAKNLWVVRWISIRLYNDLFAPEVRNFGFFDLDPHLRKIETELLNDERVPYLDLVEWRVRTCNLSKLGDPGDRFATEHSEKLAKEFYPKLGLYLSPKRPKDIGVALENIFLHAFHTSMLLRRTKIQYLWFQQDKDREGWNRTLRTDDVDLAGTVKYENFDEAVQADQDFRTIFGEVAKGDDASGRVTAESPILRKCTVLLGPIPKKSA